MSKSNLGKEKKYLNKTIMDKLRSLGVEYVNMENATNAVARAVGVNVEHLTSLAARIAVVQHLTGGDQSGATAYRQAKKLLKEDGVRRQAQKEPKRVQIPSQCLPSASQTESEIREFYDSWEWKRLSYDVKLERGRRCECCGAKAPAVRIHTDHIKPIRYYWSLRLDRSNLQILCEDCNMGKGSRDETDFRELLADREKKARRFAGMDARTYAPIGGADIDLHELPEAAIDAIRSARNSDY